MCLLQQYSGFLDKLCPLHRGWRDLEHVCTEMHILLSSSSLQLLWDRVRNCFRNSPPEGPCSEHKDASMGQIYYFPIVMLLCVWLKLYSSAVF